MPNVDAPVVVREFSLVDMFLSGEVSETDVREGGFLTAQAALRAERVAAESSFRLSARPRTAPVQRPVQVNTSVPSHTVRRSSMHRQHATDCHVDRIRARRLSNRTAPPASDSGTLPTCPICCTRPRDQVFVPCFHIVACGICSVNINTCPICRRDISTKHKVFLP